MNRVRQPIRVTLSGSHEGQYIVVDEHPDGTLVVVPDNPEARAAYQRGRRESPMPLTLSRRSG